MTPFTACDPVTGEVLFCGTADDPQAIAAARGVAVHEGERIPSGHYRDGNTWAAIPPRPSDHHAWDWATRAWADPRSDAQRRAQQWAAVRARRQRLLAASDWTDTASAPYRLGQELYDAWQEYRQELRDITLQPDPADIEWPSPPG